MDMYTYIDMDTHIDMYAYMDMYTYTYRYVCIHGYVHIHIHGVGSPLCTCVSANVMFYTYMCIHT